MHNDILKSVIEITRHRDLDSLEYSLVATLSEIITTQQITVFKTLTVDHHHDIEEILNLSVVQSDKSNPHYKWSEKSRIIKTDRLLERCIRNNDTVIDTLEDGLFRVLIPISNDNTAIGAISLYGTDEMLSSLDLVKGFIKIYENYQIILDESEHDKLTGLFNRRTFDKKLGRLLKMQNKQNDKPSESDHTDKRHKTTSDSHTWLVVLDFDGFKQINDTYGHSYGDEVLLILSQKMKQCFRKTDLLFRFGGDEFVIILEPVTYNDALDALERFRMTVATHEFPQIGTITISTGFAKISEKNYPPSILEKADKALYFAKENGRNCIFNYESLISSGKLLEQKTSGAINLF